MVSSEVLPLSVHGLTKAYGPKRAVENVSFALRRGHIYGLIGHNGCGKSTLLRLIGGLSLPSAGTLSILGSSTDRELSQARSRVGFLLSENDFFPAYSVYGNLKLFAQLKGNASKAEIRMLMQRLRLTEREIGSQRMGKCSAGQQKRAGIAAALLGKPELLILDEPFNALDKTGLEDVLALLREYRELRGMTMLIAEHHTAELSRLATDFLFLNEGKLAEQCSADELQMRLRETGCGSIDEYYRSLTGGAE